MPYEVILVDNCCTDDTVRVAKNIMRDSQIELHIVQESEPGLMFARRRGIKEVKYEYVIFCDDDNILCPNYVSTMACFLDNMPDVGAIGGKGIAEFCTEPAKIVKNNLECYAVGSQLKHKDWLFGAGLALRTELVREIYNNQQCFLMGRTGKNLLSGDDTELVMSVVLRGYNTYATDEITYIHVLKENRLTEEYFFRLRKGLMLPQPVICAMRAAIYGKKFSGVIRHFLFLTKQFIKYSILWWKPNADIKRQLTYEEIEPYFYWGFPKLYLIYHQWIQIKQNAPAK